MGFISYSALGFYSCFRKVDFASFEQDFWSVSGYAPSVSSQSSLCDLMSAVYFCQISAHAAILPL
jgi:hypothetical protein